MAPHRPSTRIAAPSFLLAVALIVGAAAPTIARDTVRPPAGALGGPTVRLDPASADPATAGVTAKAGLAQHRSESTRPVQPSAAPAAEVRAPASVPVAKPQVVSKTSSTSSHGAASPTSFKGRNHVWIPALGIDRSVTGFACSSQAYPGNRVYRWGCAGGNNIYLFGHASSVFKGLHDAYISGRLHKGMTVYYAAGDGVVHRYVVRWWKITTPTDGAWAYAGQSRPSLTLQTCVGARSQFRLIVRLARAS